jgi:hypothetical protein
MAVKKGDICNLDEFFLKSFCDWVLVIRIP